MVLIANNICLGIIGLGNMSGAILEGLLKSRTDFSSIYVFNRTKEKIIPYLDRGIIACETMSELCHKANYILLGFKPQNFPELLPQIKNDLTKDHVLISIAAGIGSDRIKSYFDPPVRVVRVMPNTPLKIGEGATAISFSSDIFNSFEKGIVISLFSSIGIVEEVDESEINAVIPICGSSPAYFYFMADAMLQFAELHGIDRSAALRLLSKTMEGAAKMLVQSGHSPSELIEMVSSKGGTTVEAMNVLKEKQSDKILLEAMEKCFNRAQEL